MRLRGLVVLRDRGRQWLVGLGVVVLFVSIFGNIYEGRMNGQDAASYHAASTRQNAALAHKDQEIINIIGQHSETLSEVENLQKQVASVIDALPAADAYLGKLAVGLENQIQSLCNAVHASCSDLPVRLPSGTTTTVVPSHPAIAPSAPATTTTTAPRHGKGHR